jgi:type VI secretion system secreted protein Hcp
MAVDTFAKIGDIKGESADSKHKDEIEVLSYSWGVTMSPQPVGGGGGGGSAGKPTFPDLAISHRLDKASPKLMLACATGQHIKEGTITARKAGKEQHEYLIIKMQDIIITGVTHGGSGDAMPLEHVTMNFAKVDLEYKPQKPDGSPDASLFFKYDLKTNKAG